MKRFRKWIEGRTALFVGIYFALWIFALGGDPFNRPARIWEARLKLFGIHLFILLCGIAVIAWI